MGIGVLFDYEDAWQTDSLEVMEICLRMANEENDQVVLRNLEVQDDSLDEAMVAMQRVCFILPTKCECLDSTDHTYHQELDENMEVFILLSAIHEFREY